MINIIQADTPYNLWEKANRTFIEKPEITTLSGSQAYIHNLVYFIESYTPDNLRLDMVGYTLTKWKLLKNKYFDDFSYYNMINRTKYYLKKNGETTAIAMHFTGSKSKYEAKEDKDPKGGPCLLSLSLSLPKVKKNERLHPKVLIAGRSSEVTQKFFADLVFVYVILKTIGREFHFKPEDCSVMFAIHSTFQTLYHSMIYWMLHSEDNVEGYSIGTDKPWANKLFKKQTQIKDGEKSSYASVQRVINFLNNPDIKEIDTEELTLF